MGKHHSGHKHQGSAQKQSDVHGNIIVQGDHNYRKNVEYYLGILGHTRTGRALVTHIQRKTTSSMTIMLYEKSDENAYAKPVGGNWQNAYVKNVDETWTDSSGNIQHFTGKGGGDSTEVHFSPERFQHTGGAGEFPSAILLHEMVHGLRQMLGYMNINAATDPDTVSKCYDNQEEFYAILLANIYSSEKYPHRPLRANHHGFAPLHSYKSMDAEHAQKLSVAFVANKRSFALIDQFVHQEPSLCYDLGKDKRLHAPFNPIRDYFTVTADTLE